MSFWDNVKKFTQPYSNEEYDEDYDEEVEQLPNASLYPVGRADDLASHARVLFRNLREADRSKPDIIYAHLPPKEGLGLALYNRMIRAAAHTIKHIPSR